VFGTRPEATVTHARKCRPGRDTDPLPKAAEAFLVSSGIEGDACGTDEGHPIVAVLSLVTVLIATALVFLAVGIARA
jgi:hypothetical protein